MRKMVKMATIVILLVATIILGCIGQKDNPDGKITNNLTNNLKVDDWCKVGTKIPSVGPTGNDTLFEIKGIKNHNGVQLCEADYDSNGTLVQYFNKEKTYNIMAIKTKNGSIQEIDVNRAK